MTKTVIPIDLMKNMIFQDLPNKNREHGFSMLEMMVAILVLSLGLLGVAGMEVATAKYRINSQANASSAQLFSELTERIRANPDAAGPSFDPTAGSAVSKYLLNDKDYATQQSDTLTAAVNCLSSVCTVDQRAEYDMLEWRKLVRNTLPQGAAWLEGNRKNGFNVTLMWMDKEQTDAPNSGGARSLVSAPICSTTTADTIFNCCPAGAQVVDGVQCKRVALFP